MGTGEDVVAAKIELAKKQSRFAIVHLKRTSREDLAFAIVYLYVGASHEVSGEPDF